jgi:NADH dehydrogenase
VSNTFGIPGVKEHAFFLKDIEDARSIRHRVLDCTMPIWPQLLSNLVVEVSKTQSSPLRVRPNGEHCCTLRWWVEAPLGSSSPQSSTT